MKLSDATRPGLLELGRQVFGFDALNAHIRDYNTFSDDVDDVRLNARRQAYMKVTNKYYDLVTDFYEYGWDESFHFAPRLVDETFRESLRRYEHYLALRLALQPGETVIDIGCGIGGPMRGIARFSGAPVIGINNNAYQISRAEKINAAKGLGEQCRVIKGDFMAIPLPDASIDKAYAVEATCHAPTLEPVYREVARVLRPGGLFGTYEWCMTDRYDPSNPQHRALKDGIVIGGGLPDISTSRDVIAAMAAAGFEVLFQQDLSSTGQIPWYDPFVPRRLNPANFRSSPIGRKFTGVLLKALESVRLAPRGATAVADLLDNAAKVMAAGGEAGVFTPSFLVIARKL